MIKVIQILKGYSQTSSKGFALVGVKEQGNYEEEIKIVIKGGRGFEKVFDFLNNKPGI
jgi:hypothetical protein